MKRIWIQALLGAALALLGACAPQEPKPPAGAQTAFELKLDGARLRARLALNDAERARGLMFCQSLPENEGMIFLFEEPHRASFWMKNTEIPLDIGYFTADGILREIHPMRPHDLAGVRASRDDIRFCLEMARGFYASKNLQPGARLDLEALKKAVEKRGQSPARFGL